jgi:acyl-CoA synthetase (AMP-forming)/AMP-acid ligase II
MAHQSVGPTVPQTLKVLIGRWAQQKGEVNFLLAVRDDRVVTYRELADLANAWASLLDEWGVRPGDRLGLLIGDPVDFSVAFIALLSYGVWVAPLDPSLANLSGAHLSDRLARLNLGGVVSDGARTPVTEVKWYDASLVANATPMADPDLTSNDEGGIILASSGTTGTPKVVNLTIGQVLRTAHLVAEHNGLTGADRGFNPLPLWHINAEVVAVLATLVAGAAVAIDDKFHRTNFWSTVDRLGATWINAVPAIISRLVELRDDESVPSRVRFIRSASAPLAPALMSRFEDRIGIPVIETYGMTEAASQICANPLTGSRKTGSVGRPVGVELRVTPIDDESGSDYDTSSIGQVEIRGPSVIRRYESDQLSDRFDPEGWLRTGDLGYLDEDGFLFLVGRSDDVINRGGEKIFPREIEEVVLEVRGVANAAVVGVDDEVFGQVPVLYIQVDPHYGDVAEVVNHVRGAVTEEFARARRPEQIIVVEEMPAHATGKIQKRSLTEEGVTVLMRSVVS